MAACVLLGCDLGAPAPTPSTPPPRILRTDLDVPGPEPARWPRDAPIAFETDRLLAPSTAARATVQVTTGGDRLLGRVLYDPARRRVTFVPEPGQMQAELEYQLVVRPGLRAWDGAALEEGMIQRFVAAAEVASPRPPPASPALARDVAPLLARHCAISGCHAPPRPVMGLDLSSPEAIAATAIGVSSRQRPGAPGTPSELTDPRWGAMLRVATGGEVANAAAYSYLVYKLLGDGPLLGSRMPPPPRAALAPDEIASISDWIARGAPRD